MNARPVVVDASVAITVILGQEGGQAAADALRTWARERRPRLVPSLFWYEVTNGLARRHGFDGQRLVDAVYQARRFGLETIEPTRAMLMLTIDRMERYGLTAYDALYLALADTRNADLATTDRALAAAAAWRAITFDDEHRLHETPAAYEHDVTWPRYKEASAYLAKLRAEALAGRTG